MRITGWEIHDQEILSFVFNCPNGMKSVKVILIAFSTHAIWKERNEMKHNPDSRLPNQFSIIRKIWGKVKGRLTYERRNPDAELTTELGQLERKFQDFFSVASISLPP